MATGAINGDWFRAKLTQHHRSQRQLAKHLGLDPSAITLMLRGDRRMQLEEARHISVFLGEPLEDVLRAAGLPIREEPEQIIQRAPQHDAVRYLKEKRAELLAQADALTAAIKALEP